MTPSNFARKLLGAAVFAILALTVAWATLALYLDMRTHWLGVSLAVALPVVVTVVLLTVRSRVLALAACFGLFAAVLAWWLTLSPPNDSAWQADVAQTPWAEVNGDKVTLHSFRNFDYVTETNYRPDWETHTVDLAQLQGVDLFMNYWGSPAIAHTILSFSFANSLPVAISIETRKQVGQTYSAFLGFFRQFALVYIIGDERDIVRVRTNYRQGEDLYLYHTRITSARARNIFLDYLKSANELHTNPQWYNALTSNCTVDIIPHLEVMGTKFAWDWRVLLNGYADRMAYDRGRLTDDGLPFDELKRRAHINDAAKAADQAPDFSRRIRIGRPGFAANN